MASPECERAIEDATTYGSALLKFISPNDVGLTGGHQYGYYIPKSPDVWPLFTSQPPKKGVNDTHPITILWQTGRETKSNVKWYGSGTRSEYRITGFGKDFAFISQNVVGDLLVLVPVEAQKEFRGYVLDGEDDIEEITAQLGVSPAKTWALYVKGAAPETETECIERNFKEFAKNLEDFPIGDVFSAATWQFLAECLKGFSSLPKDEALVECIDTEFKLFKFVERQLCQTELVKVYKDVDDFVVTALTILQRRKSRAGRALENHVDHFLDLAGVPHGMRPKIPGKPDVVIPSVDAYNDKSFPDDRLFLVACKTTAKDRWAQVLKEGKRVTQKHLLTFQKGMAVSQLQEMRDANVRLIVPEPYHSLYPSEKKSGVKILTFDEFVGTVKTALS